MHKNKPGSEKTGRVPLSLSFFLNDCYHQAPSPDSTLALRWGVCRGMYSHDGPAQVDGCAAPVHGVIQDAEGEAGHFGLHQNAEVITCGANKRVSHQAPRRWESQGALRCRYPRDFAADLQAEKTATNRLAVYSVSIGLSGNGSLSTRKVYLYIAIMLRRPRLSSGGSSPGPNWLILAFSFENCPSDAA